MKDDILKPFTNSITEHDYEKLLGQRGRVIWFYGLSGSGKSTLSDALNRELYGRGRFSIILDGDTIRGSINQDLGFSESDRAENLRRTAQIARFLAQRGAIVIVSFITPFRAVRAKISGILHDVPHELIFVKAGIETCKKRDPKGIYAAYNEGKIKSLTGVDASFEIGPHDFELDTESSTIDETLQDLIKKVRI
jgi:adenylyl-sulfate kinase